MKNENANYDIIIIGAGASGVMAALSAAKTKPDKRILILEKKDKPLLKLRATGNGRCNLVNTAYEHADEVLAYFEQLGILTKVEKEGRVYPYSEDANALADTLIAALPETVEIRTGCAVTGIEKGVTGFAVATDGTSTNTADCEFYAEKVIIAAGGKSYPEFGTTGDGYVWARDLGHSVSTLIPGLTAMTVKEDIAKLKGVRQKAKVTLLKDGKPVAEEMGEVQFREDGISGIAIMNLSLAVNRDDSCEILLDTVPEFTNEVLKSYYINTVINPKLARYVSAGKLDLKALKFTVTGLKGWKDAQVTRGGVALNEVNADTMESLKFSGLYLTGEVLDYAGPCGGYNLGNAWYTGILAGRAAAGK